MARVKSVKRKGIFFLFQRFLNEVFRPPLHSLLVVVTKFSEVSSPIFEMSSVMVTEFDRSRKDPCHWLVIQFWSINNAMDISHYTFLCAEVVCINEGLSF